MKKIRCMLFVSTLIGLVGCSVCPNQTLPSIYVGMEANEKEDLSLAEDFLYQTYRGLEEGNNLNVDLLKGDTTINLLSNSDVNQKMIVDVINEKLQQTQSTDSAIASFFYRVKYLSEYKAEGKELHAYFVGSGTSDESTLSNINEVMKEIAQLDQKKDIHIYLVGVAEDHRHPMSNALHPLGERAKIGSLSSEWEDLATQYNDYYCLEENI